MLLHLQNLAKGICLQIYNLWPNYKLEHFVYKFTCINKVYVTKNFICNYIYSSNTSRTKSHDVKESKNDDKTTAI